MPIGFPDVGAPSQELDGALTMTPALIEAIDALPGGGTSLRPVVRRHARQLMAVLDLVAAGASILIGWLLLQAAGLPGIEIPAQGHVGLWALAFSPVFVVAFTAYGLYKRERRRLFTTNFPDLVYLAHSLIAVGAATLAVSHLLKHVGLHPTISLTGAFAITAPALLTVPLVRATGAVVVRRRGLVRSRVIILGSGTVADSVTRRLATFDDLELLGCVDDPGGFDDGGRGVSSIGLLGRIADLPVLCEELDVDRIVVAFSPAAAPELADVLRQLPPNVQISVVPRLFDLLTWRSHVDELHGLAVMDVAPPAIGPAYRAVKRVMDVAVSLAIIIVALPLWATIAAMIKVTSSGPVFFRQSRRGRGGKPFLICKFRTMRVGADNEKAGLQGINDVDGPLFKVHNDPRVTSIGRILRATSLDELPQLFNVLKGEMSLVGPRPFVVDEADRIDGWAARRYDVRPGMTGLWQVSGRNDLPFEELRRLDYAYVASWSLWWDLKILWQTPTSVLRRRGAY
jgi:exopolysaccharide biosynthesis polyprenyl glycosylphosphotransferase